MQILGTYLDIWRKLFLLLLMYLNRLSDIKEKKNKIKPAIDAIKFLCKNFLVGYIYTCMSSITISRYICLNIYWEKLVLQLYI